MKIAVHFLLYPIYILEQYDRINIDSGKNEL